jgi:hypothetical protein
MKSTHTARLVGIFLLALFSISLAPPLTIHAEGLFYKETWYEDGVEHGNPKFNSRFRVNSPEIVLHPTFGNRKETRANGMMQILMEDNLAHLQSAELYLEVWGGHPHTANKRVTVNGRSAYPLPEVGTATGHCTHMYPTLPLNITDLVNGYNVFQFACDQGESFWGHFIIDNACLRTELKPEHPILQKYNLAAFNANIHAHLDPQQERIDIRLATSPTNLDQIASIEYQGYYTHYDENGNTHNTDWHGFTKNRQPVAYVGRVTEAPFALSWDIAMLPRQENIKIRAFIRFKDEPSLLYRTQPSNPIQQQNDTVRFFKAETMPKPFWSRAMNKKTCTITIPDQPRHIERAELHIVTWDGGNGKIENYFTLNGHFIPVAGTGKHDTLYSIIPINPAWLWAGENRIELLSDTEHHGIEILLPGPHLTIKLAKS